MTATSTKEKTFKSEFGAAYPYGNEAIAPVFFKYKNLFKVEESFKRNGVLYELYQFWGDIYTYNIILIDGKTVHYFNSASMSGAVERIWEPLIGYTFDQYFNGCPHYTMTNPSEIQVIKSDKRFIEFNKIQPRSQKGNPLKSVYDKIEGTPFQIGRPVMYTIKDGKNSFFYAKGYAVIKYDVEYNLSIEKRFNTRFQVVSSIGDKPYTKSLNELVSDLEVQKKKYTDGYWSDAPLIWNDPNPELEKKIQAQIEAVKKFQLNYKGQI